MASAARAAATKPVSKKTSAPAFFLYRFDGFPSPANNTGYELTALAASDERHPFHIAINRRLASWDPNRLHWNIKCPISLSKKRVVRSWATRRFRDAFLAELKQTGYDALGRADTNAPSGTGDKNPRRTRNLTGALNVTLTPAAVTAPYPDVKARCSELLRKIQRLQRDRHNR